MTIINYGVMFNGRRIVHPGAYDAIDINNVLTSTPGSLNRPIYMGEADSGIPGVVKWFSSASAAREYTSGGELYDVLDLAFSPSVGGGGGASIVGLLVTNQLTQASLSAGGLSQTAVMYGINGNKISTKLENGTITGSKRFVASRWDTDVTEVFDNLGAVIQIQYKGASAYAEINITKTGEVATLLTTKIGATQAGATVDISVDLTNTQYATVGQLAHYLSGIADYDVSFLESELPVSSLDALTSVNIKASANYIMAVSGDLIYQINKLSTLVNVSLTGTLTNYPVTYLTGGAKGSSPASWSDYFTTISKEYADILAILSANEAVHAEALAHAEQMEQRGQKRVVYVGGPLGETVDQTKRRALLLNSSRAVVAYPGIYFKNSTGNTTLYPPYFAAAMLAGRSAGVSASEPLTFDYFNLVGLETNLVAGDPDIDDLITSGVAALENVFGGGVRLAQSVTTDLTPGSPFRELSIRRGADSLSIRVTSALEAEFVGKKGTPGNVTTIALVTKDVLSKAKADEEIVDFRNITVTFLNSVAQVDYEVAYVDPINYVLVTSHFVSNLS
ncbi:MAG: phage tail sheath subtilisin-like domain-containing protein [Bacteroidota bacterium]|nr:phage tail sheath subtilisin-like domain-containing protein [Bacteroidota bacterium]